MFNINKRALAGILVIAGFAVGGVLGDSGMFTSSVSNDVNNQSAAVMKGFEQAQKGSLKINAQNEMSLRQTKGGVNTIPVNNFDNAWVDMGGGDCAYGIVGGVASGWGTIVNGDCMDGDTHIQDLAARTASPSGNTTIPKDRNDATAKVSSGDGTVFNPVVDNDTNPDSVPYILCGDGYFFTCDELIDLCHDNGGDYGSINPSGTVGMCSDYTVAAEGLSGLNIIAHEFTKNVNYGDSGEEVLNLQVDLKKAGLYTGLNDAKYGPMMRASIQKLQQSMGKKLATGRVFDRETSMYLNKVLTSLVNSNTVSSTERLITTQPVMLPSAARFYYACHLNTLFGGTDIDFYLPGDASAGSGSVSVSNAKGKVIATCKVSPARN